MGKRHYYKDYKNINFYVRKRTGLIKRLQKIKPFISGCIVDVARACGNKKCKCARGQKHVSKYLSYRSKDKKRTDHVYIPVKMLEEVTEWNKEYRCIKKIMEEICQIQREIIKKYVRVTKAKK